MNTMNSSNYVIILNNKIDIGDIFALIFVVIILILPILKLLPHLKLPKATYKRKFSQGFIPSAILTIISHIIFFIFPQYKIVSWISSILGSVILIITAIKIKALINIFNLTDADKEDIEKVHSGHKDSKKIEHYYTISKGSIIMLLAINLGIVFGFLTLF